MAARARGEGKTPVKNIRVEHELWNEFGEACEATGADRATVLRTFMRWYLRQGPAPKRPAVDTGAQPEG
ncbi:hypothetical protein [Lentzea flava]|uniref:Ribbon-helix-helix protein, copG family n=1 Tax=Lentzea flava TaxID=103732 RepID=A0ABQ2V3I1_9PSEU|nr:hypothetical protein [Lentzea flava]MCP2202733.1 hypothetical protein [Lentzea flava]GGU61572.1 hypothetical protein GCM10010178_62170 [Lentzea flava]